MFRFIFDNAFEWAGVRRTLQLRAAKDARGAAAERANLLVRDAAPALQEVVKMRDDAHAQR